MNDGVKSGLIGCCVVAGIIALVVIAALLLIPSKMM